MKKDDIKTSEGTTSKSRRRLLTALTAGGAAVVTAPTEWTKPALKSVILPAHAQTSPGGGGCDAFSIRALNAQAGGACFCMCISVHVDADCGGTGRVEVRDSSGELLTQCERPGGPFGANLVSWSCSGNANTSVVNGDLVTFDVEFSNGCTCRRVVAAS